MSDSDNGKNEREAGAFLAKMTTSAMNPQGEFEVAKARAYLQEEIGKRRKYLEALNAQIAVLEAMEGAFSGWQTVANPIHLGIGTGQPLRAARSFDDEDNDDMLNTV